MNKYKSRSDVPEKYKWDLSDFYKNNEEFDKEYNKLKEDIELINNYVGCIKDSNKLVEFLRLYIDLESRISNLSVYAHLKNDEELGLYENISRKNKAEQLCSIYSNYLSFFESELISLSNEEYNKLFENKDLDDWKYFLDEIYKNKEHILSESEEKIISDLMHAMDHYSDISSNLLNNEHDYGTVKIDGEDVTITSSNFRYLLRNKNPKIRKQIWEQFRGVRNQYGGTSASLLDSYVKAKNTYSKIHKFNNSWERILFNRDMPEKAYDALISSVENNTESLRKFIRLYKDVQGFKEVHQYDLNFEMAKSNKEYTIEEGIDLIREALKPLGEDYINKYNKIIDNHYIDFCGYKCSGGYSAATLDHNSRILLTFNNDLESVSTVAHECGHNVHDQYIIENNLKQYVGIETVVAEVASLTNECLLSSYLAKNGKTKDEKLAGIDNMIMAFQHNFFGSVREGTMERDFYNYSLNGNALTKEYLNKLSLDSLKKYYKNEIIFDENGDAGWVGRSHYYCDFYLFDYAFCISVASANASRILSGDKDALDKYIKFLSLGSNVKPIDAIKELGYDLTDTKVYEEAVKYFNGLMDEFIKISKE